MTTPTQQDRERARQYAQPIRPYLSLDKADELIEIFATALAAERERMRGPEGEPRYWEGRWRDADAENKRLREALECLIDNVETGSYESTGQAIDKARIALAGADHREALEREYEPGMDPCDDAEFGMKP